MYRVYIGLRWAILFSSILWISNISFSQNPHGNQLTIDCAACHSPEGWGIAKSYWQEVEMVIPNAKEDKARFRHSNTDFPLTGQHDELDCISCHESLVFSPVQNECIGCHTDLHQMTVGDDCSRCHTTENWLVDEIFELHQNNGFPLLGEHFLADCFDCHTSETRLRFDRIGNDCINCHLEDYEATASPDHRSAGFSTDCAICHDMTSPTWLWTGSNASHSFFPLTKGHEINECAACHIDNNFTDISTDCFACHESDYRSTTAPDHEAGGFPTDCTICHTTDLGWPATDFTQHDDSYFPIYSGKHQGEWNECAECHTTPGDFKAFSCIDCHEHNDPNDLADEHDDVTDYSYSSTACYACHPKGEE